MKSTKQENIITLSKISSQKISNCIYCLSFSIEDKNYNKYKNLTVKNCKELLDFYGLIISGEIGKAEKLSARLMNQFDFEKYVDKRILRFFDGMKYDLKSAESL